MFAEGGLSGRVVLVDVHAIDDHHTATRPEGGLDCVGQASSSRGFATSRSTTTEIECLTCLRNLGTPSSG